MSDRSAASSLLLSDDAAKRGESKFSSPGGYGGRRPPKLSVSRPKSIPLDESGLDWDDEFDDDSDMEDEADACTQGCRALCRCIREPINPDSDYKVNWDVLVMILVVYVAFMVPY